MRYALRFTLILGLICGLAGGYLASSVLGYPWDGAPWSAAGATAGLIAGLVLDSAARRAILAQLSGAALRRLNAMMLAVRPRRSWFRFSLRTMFVALTLACVGGAWSVCQRNWIRERHAFLAELAVIESRIHWPIAYKVGDEHTKGMGYQSHLPWCLRIFGETEVYYFVFGDPPSQDWRSRAQKLFPEAKIETGVYYPV